MIEFAIMLVTTNGLLTMGKLTSHLNKFYPENALSEILGKSIRRCLVSREK